MQTICYWFARFDKRSLKKNVLKTFHSILALRCAFFTEFCVMTVFMFFLMCKKHGFFVVQFTCLEITDQLIFVVFRGEKWAGWLVR